MNNKFNKKEELKKWNTIQLEAHERWSYDDKHNIQKLERIVALCHRCHSVTHYGLTGLRGLSNQSDKHLMKVNNWNEEEVKKHHIEQKKVWLERNKIKWSIDLSIISNSSIELKERK
jgi:5-methylcytosine-specific restriction endonuclease McrA